MWLIGRASPRPDVQEIRQQNGLSADSPDARNKNTEMKETEHSCRILFHTRQDTQELSDNGIISAHTLDARILSFSKFVHNRDQHLDFVSCENPKITFTTAPISCYNAHRKGT